MTALRYDADALSREWYKGARHEECHFCGFSAPLRRVDIPGSNPDDMRAGWMCLGCFVERSRYDLAPAPEAPR